MLKSIVLVLLVGVGVFGVRALMAGQDITPQEALKRIQASTAILVDVRTPEEMADGVATPAQLIPLQDIESGGPKTQKFLASHDLSAMKDKAVIFYCRSGRRSGKAVEIFKKKGYQALNLGGLSDWEKAGLPTRKPNAEEIAP